MGLLSLWVIKVAKTRRGRGRTAFKYKTFGTWNEVISPCGGNTLCHFYFELAIICLRCEMRPQRRRDTLQHSFGTCTSYITPGDVVLHNN